MNLYRCSSNSISINISTHYASVSTIPLYNIQVISFNTHLGLLSEYFQCFIKDQNWFTASQIVTGVKICPQVSPTGVCVPFCLVTHITFLHITVTVRLLYTHQLFELEQPLARYRTGFIPVPRPGASRCLLGLSAAEPTSCGWQRGPETGHRPLVTSRVHRRHGPLRVPRCRFHLLEDPGPARDTAVGPFESELPRAAHRWQLQPRALADRCVSVPPWRRLEPAHSRTARGHRTANTRGVAAQRRGNPPQTHRHHLHEPCVTDLRGSCSPSLFSCWGFGLWRSEPTGSQLRAAGCHVAVNRHGT